MGNAYNPWWIGIVITTVALAIEITAVALGPDTITIVGLGLVSFFAGATWAMTITTRIFRKK